MTKEQTVGQRMIASAKQALAFVQGEENGCVVHVSDERGTTCIGKRMQGENLDHHQKDGKPD